MIFFFVSFRKHNATAGRKVAPLQKYIIYFEYGRFYA